MRERRQEPFCGACESELRLVDSQWICACIGCPLHGQAQIVLHDAPPGDKAR